MRKFTLVTLAAFAFAPALALAQEQQMGGQGQETGQQTQTGETGQTGQTGKATTGAQKMSSADHQFLTKAAQVNMAEIQTAKLAQKMGQSDAVKNFSQQMIDDHTKALDQLKDIAQKEGVQLPSQPSAEQQQAMQSLQNKTGADFDRAYLSHEAQDHQKTINEFQKEAKSGKNADLRNYASSTLPTLKKHLDMAQRDMRTM